MNSGPAIPPPVKSAPEPGAALMDSPLRLVIILMFVNLGLSVVVTALILIFHTSLLNYELAHAHLPPSTDPRQLAAARTALSTAMWTRPAVVILVSVLYVWRSFALRRGSRRAYLRLIWIGVIGLAGIAYLIANPQYPAWMRVEQVLQAVVLIAMLIALSRKEVRRRFAKQRL